MHKSSRYHCITTRIRVCLPDPSVHPSRINHKRPTPANPCKVQCAGAYFPVHNTPHQTTSHRIIEANLLVLVFLDSSARRPLRDATVLCGFHASSLRRRVDILVDFFDARSFYGVVAVVMTVVVVAVIMLVAVVVSLVRFSSSVCLCRRLCSLLFLLGDFLLLDVFWSLEHY